ncbi:MULTISPECIES: hypothetical protein [unclassified Microbacterium]|uniref:hypothetical protein n=1 Tax=unclassified Microbacterium TaxID=2609290 RepID=UPI00365EB39A
MTTANRSEPPLIALISATSAAIAPAVDGLRVAYPSAEVWNLLDDRLLSDAEEAGGVTPPLMQRMTRLIHHAVDGGASGVLLTCSQYGPIAQRVSAPVPVLAPDSAAFRIIKDGQYARVLVLSSLKSALDDSMSRLSAVLGPDQLLIGAVSAAAGQRAREGDVQAVGEALIEAVHEAESGVDAVLLAQYSLAPARDDLSRVLGIPVISGPQTAATRLRQLIEEQ